MRCVVDIVFHKWYCYGEQTRCHVCRILLVDWEKLIYKSDGTISNIEDFDCEHIGRKAK